MKRLLTIVIVFFYASAGIFSQDHEVIDSLESLAGTLKGDEKIVVLNKLAKEYLNVSTEKAFDLAFTNTKLSRKSGNRLEEANALQIIGKTYFYNADYRRALYYFKKCSKIYLETGEISELAKVLNNIGFVYRMLGEYTLALNFFENSLRFHKKLKDSVRMANTINHIGIVYYIQGDYENALESYQNSLSINELLGDKKGVSYALNNIGQVYRSWEFFDKALEYYLRSLKIDEELEDKLGVSASLNNIGDVYKDKQDFARALEYFDRAVKLQNETGDKSGLASTLINIGDIYERKGNLKDAIIYYKKAMNIREEIGDKTGLAKIFSKIGEVHYNLNDYEKARKYLDLSQKIAEDNNIAHVLVVNLKALSALYRKLGDHRKALEYFEKYHSLDSAMYDKKKLAELQTRVETEKLNKEKELKELQLMQKLDEISRQRIYIIIAVAGFILILIFLILLLRLYGQKRKANKMLERQQQEITDSIHYASRIQTALLPPEDYLARHLPEYFILFKPRDIVSGDFYWATEKDNNLVVVAADCTGHGVPGAFMSMLGIAFLNDIIHAGAVDDPAAILNQLREKIIESLRQTGKEGETKDGMDISVCIINMKKMQLRYSGANIPLYIIRDNNLQEYKADRMPIGIHGKAVIPFNSHDIDIRKGDTIYTFSDGYADQFGGQKGKKFKYAEFRVLINNIHDKPMNEQAAILENAHNEWRGDFKQIDDILLIGMRI